MAADGDHVVRMTGSVLDGYVLTEWVGYRRVKGIAYYAAQDTLGAPVGLEAFTMAYRHGASLAAVYGARFVVDDVPEVARKLGAGTACDPDASPSRVRWQFPYFMRLAAAGVREDAGVVVHNLVMEAAIRRDAIRCDRPSLHGWVPGSQYVGGVESAALLGWVRS